MNSSWRMGNKRQYGLWGGLSVLVFGLGISGWAAGHDATVKVSAGDHALEQAPIAFVWEGEPVDEGTDICLVSDDDRRPGQVEEAESGKARIWFLADVPAGESREYRVQVGETCAEGGFRWDAADGHTTDLRYDDTSVLQYFHPVFNPDNVEETKKPFHHVYAPDGSRKVTKGPGGRYSHHRGIFFGYNGIEFDGGSADIWHAGGGEYSEHRQTLHQWAGPVFGGHVTRIHWVAEDHTVILEETRRVRAFKQSDGEIVIDFHSTLASREGEVRLDGDNHHAGVQFRAAQYVADNSDPSRFLRPAEWSDLDPREQNPGITNLPWNALQFIIEDDEYTVAILSSPSNADVGEERIMSERRYGRFGEFIPTTLQPDRPLDFRYRFWITDRRDEISRSEIEAQYAAYAREGEKAPQVKLKGVGSE